MHEFKEFGIRVYGLLLNEKDELLLSHESIGNFSFTKLPGGGLKFGEDPVNCLKREIKEELHLETEIQELLHVSDHVIPNRFIQGQQVITIYYLIKLDQKATSFVNLNPEIHESLNTENIIRREWKPIKELKKSDFTFPAEKRLLEVLRIKWKEKFN